MVHKLSYVKPNAGIQYTWRARKGKVYRMLVAFSVGAEPSTL